MDAVPCAIGSRAAASSATRASPEDRQSNSASGFTSAASRGGGGDLVGAASTSPRGSKPYASLARSACLRTPIGKSDSGSTSRSPTSARRSSRILRSRCMSMRLKSASRPRRNRRRQRHKSANRRVFLWSCYPSPTSAAIPKRTILSTASPRVSTTDLSRVSGAFVIGRRTALTYKGKAADVKEIGRKLNVRYVLEGSAQRDQIRCASTRSSSTPDPARICGPIVSTRTRPAHSGCRTKSWRDWPRVWATF